MGLWDNETDCMFQWMQAWDVAEGYTDDLLEVRAALYLYFPFITDAYIQGAFSKCADAMFDTYSAITNLLNRNNEYNPTYNAAYYTRFFAGGTVDPITWESIVEAWTAAPLDGVKFTISMLDYMREAIWDEPYNAKFFKPATEFWT